MIVSASVTERCNLSCDYCYGAPVGRSDMNETTADRVVDFAIANNPVGEILEFGFFGGEPLLRLGLIRRMALRLRDRAERQQVPIRLRTTTNGTLMGETALALIEEFDIDLCVSLDGPPRIHDLHRRFGNGDRCAEVVVTNLRDALERLDRVQVNSVFGPDTVESLPSTVEFLLGQGVRLIHLNLDISAPWPSEARSRLHDAYQKVSATVVDSYRTGRPIAVNLIDSKIILFLKDGYADEDRCGMGKTKIGIAPNGDMYPCERLIGSGGEIQLCFGSVSGGIDRRRLAVIQEHTGNRNKECERCPVSRFCMNWCGCTNFHLTGHTDLVAPVICASEQAAISAAMAALHTLAEDDLFIDHLMSYLEEGYRRKKGDEA